MWRADRKAIRLTVTRHELRQLPEMMRKRSYFQRAAVPAPQKRNSPAVQGFHLNLGGKPGIRTLANVITSDEGATDMASTGQDNDACHTLKRATR